MTLTPTSSEPYTHATFAAEWQAACDKLTNYYTGPALALLTAWQAGTLTTAAWSASLTRLLLDAVAVGTGVGDGLASRVLYLAHGRDLLPLSASVPDIPAELARLSTAVDTLVVALDVPDKEEPDLAPRVRRIAANEPVSAAQQAAVKAYHAHGVTGYRRGLDADPCELCVWLAKKHLDPLGFVYPSSKPMYKHPGCQCVPIPATKESTP